MEEKKQKKEVVSWDDVEKKFEEKSIVSEPISRPLDLSNSLAETTSHKPLHKASLVAPAKTISSKSFSPDLKKNIPPQKKFLPVGTHKITPLKKNPPQDVPPAAS